MKAEQYLQDRYGDLSGKSRVSADKMDWYLLEISGYPDPSFPVYPLIGEYLKASLIEGIDYQVMYS